MPYCGNCGAQNSDGAAYCGKCGGRLSSPSNEKICPSCGNWLPDDMFFCDQCGTRWTPTENTHENKTDAAGETAVQDMIHTSGSGTDENRRPNPSPPSSTTGLSVLSAISLVLCWPAAIYGFYCLSKARNAYGYTRDSYISKGKKVCGIGIGIVVFVLIIASMVNS